MRSSLFPLRISHQQCLSPDQNPSGFSQSRLGYQPKRTYHEHPCLPPSSMPISTPSTPRSSSCSTRRCAASRSRSAAASCWPRPTRPRRSACTAACRAGGRASSARTSSSSAATSRSTQRLGDAAIEGARRLHAAGRAHLDRRGLRRRRWAARISSARRPRSPQKIRQRVRERARPADLGRRRAHQAPGQDRLAGRQARRAGRGRSRDRSWRSCTTCRSS